MNYNFTYGDGYEITENDEGYNFEIGGVQLYWEKPTKQKGN